MNKTRKPTSQHKTISVSHNGSDFQEPVLVVHPNNSEVEHLENTSYCNSGVPIAVGERYSEYEILYRLGSSERPCLPDVTVNINFVIKDSAFRGST
jgi:hypothetical protein